MAALRESAFLPTIKCSLCGLQVEISLMGEHLCSGPSLELSPPPDNDEKFSDQSFNQPPTEKHGRLPTPVDTDAANRAYMNQGQLTPVSHAGGSRSISPITPERPSRSPDNYFARTPPDQLCGPPTPAAGKPMGEALLEKMNSIAPGPFDTNRRPSMAMNAFPTRQDSLTKWDGPFLEEPRAIDRPGTSHSNISAGSNGNITPPKQPKKSGYEGFGPPPNSARELEPSALGLISRSETFPRPSTATEPSRRPSYPPPQLHRLPSLGVSEGGRRPSTGPDTSRRPPPRKSLIPQGLPTNTLDLAAEFGSSNPYHTPSDSASSGYSTFSSQSQASLLTSPAQSITLENSPDVLKVGNGMGKLQISTEKPRPSELHIDSMVHDVPPPIRTPMPISPYLISPKDDHFDPAIQRPYRPYVPPSSRYDSSPKREQNLSPRSESFPGQAGTSPRGNPLSRKGSRDPSTQTSRGDCKSCREPITGKSISSADGRLTGKYHKNCFVCTTCSKPFTSAEFYVLNDKPYCEMHYHQLNGSLCGECGQGIEGHFVEDESRVKYHEDCFRCPDCSRSLSGGYFEVDGKAYCERDALRRTRQSPAGPSEPGSFPSGPRRGGLSGPGSRPFGGPPGRPGPGGPGPRPGFGPPGMSRGPMGSFGGPARPGPGVGPGMGPKPQMNKRATRFGMM